jgi:hypothetical protein
MNKHETICLGYICTCGAAKEVYSAPLDQFLDEVFDNLTDADVAELQEIVKGYK